MNMTEIQKQKDNWKVDINSGKEMFENSKKNKTEYKKGKEISEINLDSNFEALDKKGQTINIKKEYKFQFNYECLQLFRKNEALDFTVPVMLGYFGQNSKILTFREYTITLIGRKSRFRAGPRFLSRGIDASTSNVSNVVESEFILSKMGGGTIKVYSFISLRGSVPWFWSQKTRKMMKPPTFDVEKYTEDRTMATYNNMKKLNKRYGRIVYLSLLNNEGREGKLHGCLESCIKSYRSKSGETTERIENYDEIINFQLLKEAKNCSSKELTPLFNKIDPFLLITNTPREEQQQKLKEESENDNENSYFPNSTFCSPIGQPYNLVKQQNSIIRINCKDSIDRTNIIQALLCIRILKEFIADESNIRLDCDVSLKAMNGRFFDKMDTKVRELWVQHGNQIAQIYCGSNSLRSGYVLREYLSFKESISDHFQLLRRWYQNHHKDHGKNLGIQLSLGGNQIQEEDLIKMVDLVKTESRDRKKLVSYSIFLLIFTPFTNLILTVSSGAILSVLE